MNYGAASAVSKRFSIKKKKQIDGSFFSVKNQITPFATLEVGPAQNVHGAHILFIG